MSRTTCTSKTAVRVATCSATAALILCFTSTANAQAAGAEEARPGVVPHRALALYPRLSLARRTQGEEAITALGARLPEVARWYGVPAARLREIFRSDHSARLDRDGRVFYEEAAIPPAAPPSGSTPPTAAAAAAPLDQTFLLHSRPGAERVIYLNFRGMDLYGSVWNPQFLTLVTNHIIAEPYDLDGDPSTFSAVELAQIQNIWQRVAEDYAPFDVDVTTEQPSDDALTRFSGSDPTFGTTALITRQTFNPCSTPCGGIAYVGAFDDIGNFYKPALIFFDMLSSFEKYIAEAISHEVGHNLGLNHDGVLAHGGLPAVEYYDGQGFGPTGWAPIMGVGYGRELTQWSRGEYAFANNTQDDLQVIQSFGAPLRADDHGNSFATATILSPAPGSGVLSNTGVIESQTDVDVFRFSSGPGAVSIQVTPASLSPNLDVLATLQRDDGTVLATANPLDALNATIAINLSAPATLFVSVRGTGKGNPAVDGYSSYASIGQYTVRVTIPPQPTSISLGTSATQVAQDQPVTLTATLSSVNPAIGTVSFFDNGVLIGSASVVNGTARLTTGALGFGFHNFTVTYNGDGANLSSSSTAPTVVISGNVAALIGIITSLLLDD